MKKRWLGLGAISLGLLVAASAAASVSRDATGNILWVNTTFTDGNGRVLKVLGTDPHIQLLTAYVDATGTYGGGDTPDGRMTAKRRAIDKTSDCTWTFFNFGQFLLPAGVHTYTRWDQACGIKPTDTSIRMRPEMMGYGYFEEFIHDRWCPVARSVAAQANVTGTVYVSTGVRFFGDAAGDEADRYNNLGSSNVIPCP